MSNNAKPSLGQTLYEAYAKHAGWKSLATKKQLPQWTMLSLAIQQGWEVVGEEAKRIIMEEHWETQQAEAKALYDGL